MKSIAVLVLTALATVAAAPEPAQRGRQAPDASQTLTAPYVQPAPARPAPDAPYLFKLSSLPARLWAPVPPPYDSHANRSSASNPLGLNSDGY